MVCSLPPLGRTSSSPVSVDLRVPRAWRPAVVVVLSTANVLQLPSGPHVRYTRSSTEPDERSSRPAGGQRRAALPLAGMFERALLLDLLHVPLARYNHRSCRRCPRLYASVCSVNVDIEERVWLRIHVSKWRCCINLDKYNNKVTF